MSYRILVPLEFGALDAEVIPYLRRLATRPDSAITLLHVLPDLLACTREHIEAGCGEARERLQAFAGRLDVDASTVSVELRMGVPAEEILKLAAVLPADLVVMPAHARSGLDRLLHGSVTEQVLRRGRCPMLLPRPPGAQRQSDIDHLFDRILVPIDGSGGSFAIIPVVVEFARHYDSEVILFHDYDGDPDVGDFLDGASVGQRLQEYRTLLGYAGISVSTETAAAGRPAADILDAVSGTRADLVAMATHGRRGLERLTTGSVVEHVLRHAARPVLACNTSPGLVPDGGD